ncbi:MAG: alkaline phosphatase D family protein [Nocardiopsaceae bacterium]|nr:alkaline phosphatase D family protein [Nocardiopsaceae bacterium]
MLRHVTDSTAVIWVETDTPCRVTVTAGDHTAQARTFTVHGHHYALCELSGLSPGAMLPYEVHLDGTPVWPEPDSGHPPSLVRTIDPSAPARVLFGSCHTPTDHSSASVLRYGVDMLRARSLSLAEDRRRGDDAAEPSLLLLIGDQVYADELQPQMKRFLNERREQAREEGGAASHPPDDEVVFFDEYAELYRQAWSDPDLRWLLSTVPTLMLFDDHDIRDDWNTSGAWRRDIAQNPWWRPRITSGLGAYWIYQHVGNLSPEERAADPVYGVVTAEQNDAAEVIDAFAWQVHEKPVSYRWSYRYDIGGARVLMVDTRCGRIVEDDARRTMLGPDDSAWLDAQLTGDVDHLIVASTLPFLLPKGVHHLEAWNEAVCAGAWGSALRGFGEKLRQEIDLEHWAAFQHSFHAVSAAVLEVAAGQRGAAPSSVLFLGGDVHFSYLARARPSAGAAQRPKTVIAQLVCSPTCNWMPPLLRRLTWLAARGIAGAVGTVMSRAAGVRQGPLDWKLDDGPWYDNTLATLTLDGRTAEVSWTHSPVGRQTVQRLGSGTAPLQPAVKELTRYRLSD